ncbi:metallophosphoesterase [Anaerosphaera multitolerans]|uniref:Serine/threonine protein phosphatase n=1 Tax=Anaerosphaera multitolerans TaxID=2487351 RepID=A0A437S704_9FIRM|nr:metallophosphoesterase [Anaerosphaera multitolerans]RVU54819.1 serine/threonine protein phosphatase [Anaerosphaera multitolerans]
MIWAIGDLHFDSTGEKPMDVFGSKWENHEEKIISHWKEVVASDDLVLLPGDISWALKLKESEEDLKKIDSLPGKKIISKGNHDYWWSSLSKLKAMELSTIEFLHNNSYVYKDVGIYGTRGWISKDTQGFNEKDETIYLRELNRLKNSLESNKEVSKKIVMIHYPPFNQDLVPNEFAEVMSEYGVDICIYGHLHSEGHKFVVEGVIGGVEYRCVSSDYVDFKLQEIII